MSFPLLETLNQLAVTQAAPAVSFDLIHMWHSMGPSRSSSRPCSGS